MALPKPEETVMGITAPKKKARAVRPVLAPIERKDPPKVAGITEFVGTQRPSEAQKPEKSLSPNILSIEQWSSQKYRTKDLSKNEKKVLAKEYQAYVNSTSSQTAGYNTSVKTYNKAIGYLDPAADKAAAKKMLKRTGVKTVMR